MQLGGVEREPAPVRAELVLHLAGQRGEQVGQRDRRAADGDLDAEAEPVVRGYAVVGPAGVAAVGLGQVVGGDVHDRRLVDLLVGQGLADDREVDVLPGAQRGQDVAHELHGRPALQLRLQDHA